MALLKKIASCALWGRILIFVLLTMASMSFIHAQQEKGDNKNPLSDLRYKDGNERENDVRALKTELLVAKSESLAMEQIDKLLRKYRGTPMEPDLWFRKAELYMRRSKTDRFFEIHRQSETVVSLAPQKVKAASSRKLIQQGIEVYDMIERRFKNYEQMDLVVFNNAFARQSIGDLAGAEKLYWRLIKSFPGSFLVPDAHLAIGEMAFDAKRFKVALEHFNAIKNYPHARVYPYGLYKAGWTHYNLGNARAGIKELEQVVEYSQRAVAENENRLDLRKEALNDMTIFYEDVFPAKDAFKYFKAQAGEEDVGPVLLRLAELYKRHSRFDDKRVVLSTMARQLPHSSSIPEVHEELVWNFESLKDRPAAVTQMEQFSQVCSLKGSWLKVQTRKGNLEAQKQCLDRLTDVSLKLAGKWLKMWRKNTTVLSLADVAEKAFEIHLRHTTSVSEEASQARFAYAELLFQRDKFRQASQEYTIVGQQTKDSTLGHDARYAALLSLEKAVGDKWNDKDEKSFQQLAKTYLTHHPKGKFRLEVEFKMALIAYEKGRYDEAGPIFLRLGSEFAKTEKGLKSQDLYLDILNSKKDYAGLKDYSKSLMKPGLDPARQAKLTKIYEEAYFLQIQKMEEGGQLAEAIPLYKKFAKDNPKSDLAEKGWWNAVQLQFKINDDIGAAHAAVEFYNRFPKSKEATNALIKAAQTFEATAQLGPAAEVLEKLAKEDHAQALKWKGLAADFYLLSGQVSRAKSLYRELRTSGKGDVAFHGLEKLTHIEKNQGGTASHESLLKEMIASGRQPQASLASLYFLEKMAASSASPSEVFQEAKKILNMKDASPSAKAKARFIQADILEREFRQQSMKAQAERVALVLALKTEKLEKAQAAYQDAIRYGDATVAVSSLRRLAGCYSHYVQALREMPIPEGVSEAEAQAFKAELDKLAIPLEEKSVETMAEALHQGQRLGLRDGTIAEINKELDRLNMRNEQPIEIRVEPPSMSLPKFLGANI